MRPRIRCLLWSAALLLAFAPVAHPTFAQPSAALGTRFVREGNLRDRPSTTGAIVMEVTAGSSVTVSGRAGDWAQVTVTRTGTRGWAIRSLLGLSQAQFASLPPAGATAPSRVPVKAVQGTTVLLVGTDRRPGQEAGRADAISLLRIDPEGGSISVLSLPRDLLVSIPGYGSNRLNLGYFFGGLALQKRTVSEFLGVRIDHAVAINFGGFEGLIDAIGGITVDVPRRLIDNAYPTADNGTRVIRFEPGVQRMNGARALIYSRTRHPDSDFGRIRRQQQVLAAIGARLRELGATGTLARSQALADALDDYVVSDMPVLMAASTLWNARYSGGNVRNYVLDMNYARQGNVNDPHALVPDRVAVNTLVARWSGR